MTLASGDRWSAIFYTTQNHGSGTSAGVFTTTYIPISSSSTAKFDGGNQGRDIGDFVASYDPGIIGAS